jgi:hypothetical protein
MSTWEELESRHVQHLRGNFRLGQANLKPHDLCVNEVNIEQFGEELKYSRGQEGT